MDLCSSLICIAHFLCFVLLVCIILGLLKGGSLVGRKKVYPAPGKRSIMSNAIERLRQLLGSNSWNYCVLWKLSDDQRFLELLECCCGGNNESSIENRNGEGEEFVFPCRDVMCQHPRTTTCEALAQLPTSQPLDGINMETLISNQPRWLNFSNISDSSIAQLSVGTKVLIPIPGGLVELYAAKQLNEDQTVIDYVIAQFTPLMEQEAMNNASNMCPRFSININMINDLQTFAPSSDQSNANQVTDHMNLPAACDTTAADQMCTPNSSMNFLQQISYASENNKGIRNDFVEGSNDSFQAIIDHHGQQLNSFRTLSENGFEQLMNNATNMHNLHVLEPPANEQQAGNEKGSLLKHEMGRADSISDSDHLDDEDDPKYRRRAGKGPQSKNLVAERKRRKKLNERLYHLRSLVPNISKLDRASILGDAIEYVQELQKEANDLQNELERNSDDEGANQNNMINHHHNLHRNNFSSEVSNPIGAAFGPDYDHENPINGFHSENIKGSQNFENANDKAQQMEVQVEVAQLEGNDFFVKVFGEQKKGGFVRLMEALSCLGMEITNVNMTSCISLVSYVFIVKKRDSETVQAEYLRDSLLEATRTQAGFWTDMAKASENESGIDHHHQHHQHHLHSHHMGPFHHHVHHLSNN